MRALLDVILIALNMYMWIVIAAALGAFWAPAMAMLSDAAEATGLDQALAAALINVAWAGGQIVGAGAGGAVAKGAGDGIPLAAAAVMCAATLAALARMTNAERSGPQGDRW